MTDNQLAPGFEGFAHDICTFQETENFHKTYYRVLELFARKKIPKIIVTMPPQHGKSHAASVLLPAYILGIDPERHVTIASYSDTFAARFNRRAQRMIDSKEYAAIFPETTIKPAGKRKNTQKNAAQNTKNAPEDAPNESAYIRTAEHVEIIGHAGELLSVGREGPLTGNRVDTIIIDDLYKNAAEANSPIVRENCWEWYTAVVKTRLHNDSNELIVNTRWHEEDLVGMIGRHEKIVPLTAWEQLDDWPADTWLHLSFEALKDSPPTEIDPRTQGEPLWPERQNAELLLKKRALNPVQFECLYQGRPSPPAGLLYGGELETYDRLPDVIVRRAAYIDTADKGEDFLCAVAYVVDNEGIIYVIDVVHTQEPMQITEPLVAEMLVANDIRAALVESNNGGGGFARTIQKLAPQVRVDDFSQSGNKESRILTNSSTVLHRVRMPADWRQRWPVFAGHVTTYRRLFAANRWHDAVDVLTGIVEKESPPAPSRKKIKTAAFRPLSRRF